MKKIFIILAIFTSFFIMENVKAYVPDDYIFTDSGATEWTINDITFSKKDIENAFVSKMGEIPENYFCAVRKDYGMVVCPYDYDNTSSDTEIYIGSSSCVDSATCTDYPPETTYAHFSLMKAKYLVYRSKSLNHTLKSSESSSLPYGLNIYNWEYAPNTKYEMLYSTYDLYTNYTGGITDNEDKEHLIFKKMVEENTFSIYASAFVSEGQAYSVDLTLDPTKDYSNSYFEIDFALNEPERASLDSFDFIGLVNENGLYHYEDIPFSSTDPVIYIEDYEENIENGHFKVKIDGLVLDPNNKYEKIIVKTRLRNVFSYSKLDVSTNMLDMNKEDIFLNSFSEFYISEFLSTSDFKYLNLTTPLEEYKKHLYISLVNENNDLFLDHFSTESLEYVVFIPHFFTPNSYLYGMPNLSGYTLDIGTLSKRGAWLTTNHDQEYIFDFYMIFDYRDLYFSYTKNVWNEGATIIDNNGNVINGNLKPSDDVVIRDESVKSTYFSLEDIVNSLNNYIKDLNKTSDYFDKCFHVFWDVLPKSFQLMFIVIFVFVNIFAILKIGGALNE